MAVSFGERSAGLKWAIGGVGESADSVGGCGPTSARRVRPVRLRVGTDPVVFGRSIARVGAEKRRRSVSWRHFRISRLVQYTERDGDGDRGHT